MLAREEEALTVEFEPITDALRPLTLKATCVESNSTDLTFDIGCDEILHVCEIRDLAPATRYNIQLVSCLKAANEEDVCSEPSPSLDEWTLPGGLS